MRKGQTSFDRPPLAKVPPHDRRRVLPRSLLPDLADVQPDRSSKSSRLGSQSRNRRGTQNEWKGPHLKEGERRKKEDARSVLTRKRTGPAHVVLVVGVLLAAKYVGCAVGEDGVRWRDSVEVVALDSVSLQQPTFPF